MVPICLSLDMRVSALVEDLSQHISTTPSGKGWKSSEIQALADRFLQVPDMFPIVSDTPNISDLDGSGYPGWCMVVLDAGFKICQQFSRKCSAFCCLHQPWTVGLSQTLMPGDNRMELLWKQAKLNFAWNYDSFMMPSWFMMLSMLSFISKVAMRWWPHICDSYWTHWVSDRGHNNGDTCGYKRPPGILGFWNVAHQYKLSMSVCRFQENQVGKAAQCYLWNWHTFPDLTKSIWFCWTCLVNVGVGIERIRRSSSCHLWDVCSN